MLKNYLIISLRHLLRNKAYTLINVLGLTLGVSVCILIFLIISKELSYDRFHDNYKTIYRINKSSENASGKDYTSKTPYPLKEALENDLTEIKQLTRFHLDNETSVRVNNDVLFEEDNILFIDSSFFEVLDFGGGEYANVFSGNFKSDISKPGSVFLSESQAKKYFGESNPIGQNINLGNKIDTEVKGIIRDFPETSHIQSDILVSYSSLTEEYIGGFDMHEFGVIINGFHYILKPNHLEVTQIEKKLNEVLAKYSKEEDSSERLFLQPLSDIHFNTLYADESSNVTDYNQLTSLALIALFIISIASINFINLATAIGVKRAREVGVRKVLGASRRELIIQHLGEAFIITLFSLLLGLGIVERIIPYFNELTGQKLILDFLGNPLLLFFLTALLFIISFLSGIYPAIVLSGYQPVKALKSTFNSMNKKAVVLRRGLVVFQFGIAQALIIGAIIISKQLNYFQEKPLGFEKEAIVDVFIPEPADSVKRSRFYNQVMQLGKVSSISFNLGAPTSGSNIATDFNFPEVDESMNYDVDLKIADFRYKDTYGLKLLAGNWFTEQDERSPQTKFVVNETLIKKMGITKPSDAIGKVINTGLNDINAEIIGVVEDFHVRSLHAEIPPIILIKFPMFYYNAGIKFNAANIKSSMNHIENIWNKIYPGFLFDYDFLDDSIAQLYKKEQQTFRISQSFAGIAIFIGCLGLLGLSSFMVNQRKKEIGVRKVLGASNCSIIFLFSKEFLKLLFIAFVVAAPIAWYFMDSWLTDFAYRISISIDIFILTLLLSVLAALVTVSFQSIKAAFENPVKALKSE